MSEGHEETFSELIIVKVIRKRQGASYESVTTSIGESWLRITVT